MSEHRYYPHEICLDCGKEHGRPRHSQAIGMWTGKCGWCGKEGPVCAPRDFLFPDWNGTPPSETAVNCCTRSEAVPAIKLTREQRRQMERENAKRPGELKQIPRSEWPASASEKLIEVWISRFFLVQIYNEGDMGIRLSVNRTLVDVGGGWQQDITWEQMQAVKRECGYGDRYAVEVFPRDKDVVNVANMRHLWIQTAPLNIGWTKT